MSLREEQLARLVVECALDAVVITNADDEIATSDAAVATTCRKLGIDLVVLPDSSGRQPDAG